MILAKKCPQCTFLFGFAFEREQEKQVFLFSFPDNVKRNHFGVFIAIGVKQRADLGTKGREIRGVLFASCGELVRLLWNPPTLNCETKVGAQRRTAHHGEGTLLSDYYVTFPHSAKKEKKNVETCYYLSRPFNEKPRDVLFTRTEDQTAVTNGVWPKQKKKGQEPYAKPHPVSSTASPLSLDQRD